MSPQTRRSVTLLGLGALATGLSACSSDSPIFGSFATKEPPQAPRRPVRTANYAAVYGSISGEQFPIPAFDYTSMDPDVLRANVDYPTSEAPGTIVVEPRQHVLYFVESGGRATRYGVGVGREGFGWNGIATINVRRAWPDWVPPREMVERDPAVYAQLTDTPRGRGIPGGSKSPLGARAMYLAAGGRDTGYRIHGTWEPGTIGSDVSSGCIRMINQDIIHLYGRTTQTNRVVVVA